MNSFIGDYFFDCFIQSISHWLVDLVASRSDNPHIFHSHFPFIGYLHLFPGSQFICISMEDNYWSLSGAKRRNWEKISSNSNYSINSLFLGKETVERHATSLGKPWDDQFPLFVILVQKFSLPNYQRLDISEIQKCLLFKTIFDFFWRKGFVKGNFETIFTSEFDIEPRRVILLGTGHPSDWRIGCHYPKRVEYWMIENM